MDKKIKVVVMVPSPLTERWMTMFCMDYLSQQFDFDYWDCSDICMPAFEASSVVDRSYVRKIGSREEMERYLKELPKDTLIMSHIHLDGFNYKIHKLISKYNKNRIYVDFWANNIFKFIYSEPKLEDVENQKSVLKKIKESLRKIDVLYYMTLLFKYLKNRDVVKFKAKIDERRRQKRSKKAMSLYNNINISVLPKQTYSINHPDYEKYISVTQNDCGSIVDGEYIVFIDQYYPLHPFLKSENPDVDFDKLVQPYYTSLNQFFDKIEKEFGCPVVIAAHPIANFEINPFGGRRIIYFKTAELVQHSKAVLMHNSFSISFVLLFDKPFCLITNKTQQCTLKMCEKIELYGRAFVKEVVNTDSINDVRDILKKSDREVRNKYINMFFDTTVTQLNGSLLSKHLKSIYDELYSKG